MAHTDPSDVSQVTLAQLMADASEPPLARPVTLTRALTLIGAAAQAVDRYQARWTMHGALTPAALVVHEDDRLTITPPPSTSPGLPSGNDASVADAALYWSPQRRAGESARPSDDLFALGVIAMQLLRAAGSFAPDGVPHDALSADTQLRLRPLTAWSPSERPASGAELVRVVNRAVTGPADAPGSDAAHLSGTPRPHAEPPWAAASRVALARRAHRLAQSTPPRPVAQTRRTQVRAPLGRGHYPDMPLPTVLVAAIVVVLGSVYLLPLYFMLFPAG